MPDSKLRCHACGAEHAFDGPVGRSAVCDGCGGSLKCCLNCDFHDPSSYNECREPSAERVVDKQASNFCDYFRPGARGGAGLAASSPGDARADLDELFGGSSGDDGEHEK